MSTPYPPHQPYPAPAPAQQAPHQMPPQVSPQTPPPADGKNYYYSTKSRRWLCINKHDTTHPQDPRQPRPWANFTQAWSKGHTYRWVFTGRASRSEYWWVVLSLDLVVLLISIPIGIFIFNLIIKEISSRPSDEAQLFFAMTLPLFLMIFAFISAIPMFLLFIAAFLMTLSLFLRRLQDAGFSPWWALLCLGGLADTIFIPTLASIGIILPGIVGTCCSLALFIMLLMPSKNPQLTPQPIYPPPNQQTLTY
ncbi:MAG: DUF805 domain-containing protein [Rothia sp. (in: high G+C Gram-positive bacteria)]|nr:DUF805 domain-containing protein [Rothia sp. (in: high G+C Gram-positive bacteria)]